jgi:hypothetical protein
MLKRLLAVLLGFISGVACAQQPSVAFFYGDKPPMSELRAFDWVVVEPGHLPDPKPHQHAESEVFAYVSLGEVLPNKPYFSQMPTSWLKGDNKGWNSRVIDQTAKGWADFAVEKLFEPLWQAGYRSFFLDTLDSFNIIAKTDAERSAQAQGLANVIAAVKTRFPQAKLIFNRGFEILPITHQWADAVAFESWISGYDADKKRYRDVPQADRDWLAGQLSQVKTWNIPIIAIDYVAPEQRDKARSVAKMLQAEGFIPWVANPELDMLGVGSVEVMPRRVLMVTNPVPDEYDYHFSTEVTYPTAILNAMGYAVDYAPINRPLSTQSLVGRYAGVVSFLSDAASIKKNQALSPWLRDLKQQKIPFLALGDISFFKDKQLSQIFGVQVGEGSVAKKLTISTRSAEIGFEKQVDLDRIGFFSLKSTQTNEDWLVFKSEDNQQQTAIAMTTWGGFAIAPHVFETDRVEVGYSSWVVNPYRLFEQGLQLKPMPLPDTTTEAGKRLLMVHHDGDGFASRAEMPSSPFASQVLLDEIIKKYPLPMTISVIEGETSTTGLYAKDSPALEKIARNIFAQPNVEIASHTYSHPFSWSVVAGARSQSNLYQSYNLAIPNYKPTMQREVQGSIDYVNNRLAPKDKKVAIIHWSGDCNPGQEALLLAEKAGIVSVNGGDTLPTHSHPTLTKVGPVGLNKDGVFQVYAPNQNENVYTNDWTGPFYGFERSLETHQLTESPRRIKPVNIYFHTYLMTKPEGLKSLKKVLDWTIKQDFHPIKMSAFVRKAQDFNRVVVAKAGDAWLIRGLDHLQQLRLPQSMGYPDLINSRHIAGFNDDKDMRYVHAVGNEAHLMLTPTPSNLPHLIDANASVTQFLRTNTGFKLKLSGSMPLTFTINAPNCQVISDESISSATAATSASRTFRSRHAAATIETLCRP